MAKKLTLIIGMIFMTGCAIRNNLETPFNNPTNTPILHDGSGDGDGPGTQSYCVPDAKGNYDGAAIALQQGMNSDDSTWAQGGGCVLRPIREVWAVLNNLEVMKFVAADNFTAQRTVNPTPQFTHLYAIRYTKSTPLGPIWWTIDWYHGIGGGTFLAPESVNINYQRTAGTPFMPVWKGGLVLTKVTNTVTSVGIRNIFRAAQSDEENSNSNRDTVNEIMGHLRQGAPDWTRLNTGLKDNPDQPDPAPVTAEVSSLTTEVQ
jgi:hypothetical protein